MDALQAWGLGLIAALQSALPGLSGPMKLVSAAGSPLFFTFLLPLLYWCVDYRLGLRFLYVIAGGDALNGLAKLAFHAPRPYWLPGVRAGAVDVGYGLPSGHAQASTVAWSLLARASRRAWAWAAAALLILAVSFSRVYLAVHFPHDVLGGWLIGLGLLALAWWAEPGVVAWLKQLSPAGRYLAALILPIALLALWALVSAGLAGVTDPPEWKQQAALAAPPGSGDPFPDPRRADSIFTEIGVVSGASLGLAYGYERWRFDAGGPWARRAARFGLGIVGLLILQFGLGAIFPDEPLALGYALRALRYALIGLWAMGLAPALFLKLNLAERAARV